MKIDDGLLGGSFPIKSDEDGLRCKKEKKLQLNQPQMLSNLG